MKFESLKRLKLQESQCIVRFYSSHLNMNKALSSRITAEMYGINNDV